MDVDVELEQTIPTNIIMALMKNNQFLLWIFMILGIGLILIAK